MFKDLLAPRGCVCKVPAKLGLAMGLLLLFFSLLRHSVLGLGLQHARRCTMSRAGSRVPGGTGSGSARQSGSSPTLTIYRCAQSASLLVARVTIFVRTCHLMSRLHPTHLSKSCAAYSSATKTKSAKAKETMGHGHVAPCAGRWAGSRQPGHARGSFFVRA